MPGQFLLPYHSTQPVRSDSGLVSDARDRRLWTVVRRWSSALADRVRAQHGGASGLLAAVHTDVVGYSRLFALDDVGTVARLRDLRRTLFAPVIRRHRG